MKGFITKGRKSGAQGFAIFWSGGRKEVGEGTRFNIDSSKQRL